MTLKVSLVYSLFVVICFGTTYSEAGWAKPENEPSVEVDYGPDIDLSSEKTCEMVCRTVSKGGTGVWGKQSFMMIISGIYTCRMQDVARRIRANCNYADIFIHSNEPTTNDTKSYCTHASILSLASDTLANGVALAIDRHVRDLDRNRSRLPTYVWPSLKPSVVNALLDYIYTDRIRDFDAQEDTIALFVGAWFFDLRELMEYIQIYLIESFDVLRQLFQLVTQIRYAHDNGYIALKEKLIELAQKVLKMSPEDFNQFIKDICEPNGYYRTRTPTFPTGPSNISPVGPFSELPRSSGSGIGTNLLDEIRYNRTILDRAAALDRAAMDRAAMERTNPNRASFDRQPSPYDENIRS